MALSLSTNLRSPRLSLSINLRSPPLPSFLRHHSLPPLSSSTLSPLNKMHGGYKEAFQEAKGRKLLCDKEKYAGRVDAGCG
ncbi:hypothetical protein RIF29_08230 [Crotalaria pallida]|uniref:Uncharacterized protein n=1 Tax=Crotalaria pallida TaxID=3830 RepID=A0AAN9J815_CROPI